MLTGRRFGGTVAMSSPSIRIRPPVGCSKPASMRKSVVLPQPDGPSRAKNSLAAMFSETSSTAATLPNRLDTCSIWTMGRPPLLTPEAPCPAAAAALR